ncbi:MAG TPA: tetratricopeptide repeat protein, partial [Thermoanaerobaculia bacterium]|nr:tetratricopeptide repeat protein [Thermoanaerobaculia bacterium]
MNAESTQSVYPGNPSLPREVKEKILSTFRHTLNLFHEGKLDDCIIGCDFILKMDARFTPGRQLLEKARNPASAVDVAQLESIVATTPTRQERVVAADPGRLLVRAVESFNARDFDAAITAARNVLDVLPGNQDALEILEKATRKKSSQPVFDASRERALAALESNRKEDARVELDKMRALDPDHPAVALLERRIGPSAAPPPKPQGTVAKAVPPPPPNFGGLDLDLPEETSPGGFGAETREPEIQFDDNATVAMKIP